MASDQSIRFQCSLDQDQIHKIFIFQGGRYVSVSKMCIFVVVVVVVSGTLFASIINSAEVVTYLLLFVCKICLKLTEMNLLLKFLGGMGTRTRNGVQTHA